MPPHSSTPFGRTMWMAVHARTLGQGQACAHLGHAFYPTRGSLTNGENNNYPPFNLYSYLLGAHLDAARPFAESTGCRRQ